MSERVATIRCSGSPSCACPWHYPEGWKDEPAEDCNPCCGTGCRLGPDGCNGRQHAFIGCATCIACNGTGLAQNGRGSER